MNPYRIVAALVLATGLIAGWADAQYTAEVSGTVLDQSGGVLPGVTITATHQETGNVRTTTTLENGGYSLKSLSSGLYQVKADLPGFTTIARSDIRLSLGQSLRLDFEMSLTTVEETVNVVGESPLVDPTRSNLAGAVNTKQIEALPINGRDWLNLSVLAPGAKNDAGSPKAGVGTELYTTIVVDGAEANNKCCPTLTNIRVSQDALAEFQVITNRFDARYGRSGSVIVNASTKSGTNDFHGAFLFFVRDDKFNAKDFFTNRVEPFHNSQVGASLGGPIVQNKTHFFFNFERHNEPRTVSANTSIPAFDAPLDSATNRKFWLGRVDHQFNPANRLDARLVIFDELESNFGVSGRNVVPFDRPFVNQSLTLAWTSVLSSKALNDFRVNLMHNDFDNHMPLYDGPQYDFPSVLLGGPNQQLSRVIDDVWHIRSDFAYYQPTSKGSHDIKAGAEVEHTQEGGYFGTYTKGWYFFNSDPPNIATCCMGPRSSWDLSRFPTPTGYRQGLGSFDIDVANTIYGFYFQDDWTIHPRLTLNLGVRYDIETGSLGGNLRTTFVKPHEPDRNNIQPRFGFAYDLSGRGGTVLRGGVGIYFDQVILNTTFNQQLFNGDTFVVATVPYDGRQNFFENPLNGRTFEDFVRGGAPTEIQIIAEDMEQPKNISGSIGLSHQIGANLSVSADYVHTKGDPMLLTVDKNLFCCTDQGYPLPVATFGRPQPQFSRILERRSVGHGKYDGLQLAANRRLAGRYQFGLSYLLSWNKDTTDGWGFLPNNPFDLEAEYADSLLDQRHRFVANWVIVMPYQFELNGILYAASGRTLLSNAGSRDIFGVGAGSPQRPLCGASIPACAQLGIAPGTLLPRNPIKSDAVARLDLRVSRRFSLWQRVRAEGVVEWFNVLNRRNYDPTRYGTNVFVANWASPGRSPALAYQPRQMQLGLRVTF